MFEEESKPNTRSSNSKDVFMVNEVIVRKIYVSEVPNDMTLSTMWNIFSEIGPVESVVLKKTYCKMYGVVTFVNGQDAAKALKWQLLGGKPAVHQHNITMSNNNEINEREKAGYVIDENESLLQLNNKCLLHIFSYLNLNELLELDNVCSRFSKLVNSDCYKDYQVIDIDNITDNDKIAMNPRLVLKKIGNHIKEIKMRERHKVNKRKNIIETIPEYCKNLEIVGFYNLQALFKKSLYFPMFQQLKILTLSDCDISDNMLEKWFKKTDSILELNLSLNRQITGRCLTKLRNLHQLDIHGCCNIKPVFFSKFCMNNKTLKYLNIADCESIFGKNFRDITENLINLEHISLSHHSQLTSNICELANLDKLRNIQLIFTRDNNNIYFSKLINELTIKNQLESLELQEAFITNSILNSFAKFTKIEELKIIKCYFFDWQLFDIVRSMSNCNLKRLSFNFSGVTISGILECVEMCPNLEFLDVTEYLEMDEELIIKLPAILKERTKEKNLTVVVFEYMFNEFIKYYPSFLFENKNFLKVVPNTRYISLLQKSIMLSAIKERRLRKEMSNC